MEGKSFTFLKPFCSTTHHLVACFIGGEIGMQKCKNYVPVSVSKWQNLIPDSVFVSSCHPLGQSSPALILMLIILFHPPPTPAQVGMSLEVTLQSVH